MTKQTAHLVLMAGSLTLSAALVSCSVSGDGLPSLGNSGESASSTDSDSDAVYSFSDCLSATGLTVTVAEWADGRHEAVIGEEDVVWVDFDAGVIVMPAERPTWLSKTELDVILEMDQPTPTLLVGGVDYTEDYVKCRDSTGYEVTRQQADPRLEAVNKQAMASATNNWIACARENGFPGMADVTTPRVDNWTTLPFALLPTNITESELRALIDQCPAFDLEAQLEWDRAAEDNPELDPIFFPNIGFDAPGFNGDSSAHAPGPDDDRLRELLEIVYEPQTAYWDSLE
jgi:hypothetical protein